jgi:uncharacterized membrane protein YeiH
MRVYPGMRTRCNSTRTGMVHHNKRIGKPEIFVRQGLPYGLIIGDLFLAPVQDMCYLLFHNRSVSRTRKLQFPGESIYFVISCTMDMPITFSDAIDITGTFSFAVAGALAAMEKKLDPFGVLIISFVTAIGGGTVRDVLLGATPVAWLTSMQTVITILTGTCAALLFANKLKRWTGLLTFFDALGLGFFTLIGLEKAVQFHLQPAICIALGTITGCFGGVLRDVLLNNVPLVFRKEIYASASIAGGILYFILIGGIDHQLTYIISMVLIVLIRLLALRFKWFLPAWY